VGRLIDADDAGIATTLNCAEGPNIADCNWVALVRPKGLSAPPRPPPAKLGEADMTKAKAVAPAARQVDSFHVFLQVIIFSFEGFDFLPTDISSGYPCKI
jgi:hypothetical protein